MRTAVVTTVALPNGIGPSGARRVSVFLTPRLRSDEGEELELFPALLDWPAAIGHPGVGFVVEVAGHGAITTRVVSARPSSPRWRSLFRPTHHVAPEPGMGTDERVLITYPYAALADDLERRYAEAGAASVTRLPSRPEMLRALDDVMSVARRGQEGGRTADDHVRALLDRAELRVAQRRAGGSGGDDSPIVLGDEEPEGLPRHLMQFEAFHHVFDPVEQAETSATRGAPRVDFHSAIAALGDHPWLLRELGLVIELELLAAPFASTAADPGRLRAFPLWNGHEPTGVEVRSRWVGYVAGPSSFRTADRPGRASSEDLVGGLLAIGEGGWDLVQVDVDGGVLKLLGAAASAADRADEAAARGHEVAGAEALPALRSGGLTLARRSSASAHHRSLVGQRQLAAADADDETGTLFAADVTRGYRMDVQEHRTGAWRSLLARVVQATVEGEPALPPVHDEGVVRRGVRHAAFSDPSLAPTYVHDALGRWDGWSLAAPHPGLALSKDGGAPDDTQPETMPVESRNPPVAGGIPISIEPRVEPGSLPRLRYGERYHVRLRAVDLAGNGPSLAEADGVTGADSGRRLVLPFDDGGILMVRYEPIGSPELVCRAMVGPGESLAHLVIRSDIGVGAAQWAEDNGVGGATCERHVVPPKTSQLQAERHGMFDAAIGTGVAATAMYEIARRDKGRLDSGSTRLLDGTTRHRRARLEDAPAGQYVVDPDAQLVVPYLPDPVAEAVTVSGAPGAQAGKLVRMDGRGTTSGASPVPLDVGATPEALLRVSFGEQGRWPDLLPFRLVLAEGGAPPRWDPAARALVLSLPPGGRARIELSCAPSRARLDQLAPRAWARGRHPDAAHEALAEAGRVWQISPARSVELVHAVQRPVRAPVIRTLVANRSPGETSALLTGVIAVHGATSERLDLQATWEEPAGWGSSDLSSSRRAHVLEHPLHVSHDQPANDQAAPVATSADAIRYDEDSDEVVLSAPFSRPSGGRLQPARTPRHELGDTLHRTVTYEAVATSRFREYLPEALWANPDNVTRRSSPVVVDIPSSARPVAPMVEQVLPTFAWRRGTSSGPGIANVRRGGGLRVYLQPPWFSSGEGELLGVALRGSNDFGPQHDRMTRWGADPIWSAGGLRGAPRPEQMVGASAGVASLPLFAGGPAVTVAGYPVVWDDERDLWSSDIAFDLRQSHTPFIRLALVRWQPHSLPGLELSPLVLAELAQPAPDRVLTILRSVPDPLGGFTGDGSRPDPSDPQPQPLSVRLLLEGPGPATRTTVSVQQRMFGTRDEVGWVDVAGPSMSVSPMDPPTGSAARWAVRVSFDDVSAAKFRLLVRESEVFSDGRLRTLFLETIEL
jgi:hypothetical protein